MNNLLKNIDKAKLAKVLGNSGAVGLAAALAYAIPHLTPDVVGPVLAAPIAVVLTLVAKAVATYLKPDDAPDVVTPSVGLSGARGGVHAEKLEEQTCECDKALASYLEGK